GTPARSGHRCGAPGPALSAIVVVAGAAVIPVRGCSATATGAQRWRGEGCGAVRTAPFGGEGGWQHPAGALPPAAASVPKQGTSHDHALDLVRALVDLGDLGVPHHPLHREVPGVA